MSAAQSIESPVSRARRGQDALPPSPRCPRDLASRAMSAPLPLSTLLSQPLVAHTIELDNEFERRFAETGERARVASVVMWSNFLRFVGDGIEVGALPEAAGLPKARVLSTVGGMERWRYVFVAPASARTPPKVKREGRGSGRALRKEWVVRPTSAGRKAQEIWPPLFDEVDTRWAERFGVDCGRRARGLAPIDRRSTRRRAARVRADRRRLGRDGRGILAS